MGSKDLSLPFSKSDIEDIAKTYPTPFYIYDKKAIIENSQRLLKAFSWAKGFKEYFAVKALPNPHILNTLAQEGFGADCSSMTELLLAQRCGLVGQNIMFTSNNTPACEFQQAKQLGAIINLDDITHIDFLSFIFCYLICLK